MNAAFEDFKVGDKVYCLAWIGQSFEVVSKSDRHRIISLQGAADSTYYGAQIDIFPDTMWMLTREKWDQIWYWPDRAGERYDQVFDRFVATHKVDEVVEGYVFSGGLAGMFIDPDPARAMMFQIRALDQGSRQIRVHPVAAIAAAGASLETSPAQSAAKWLRSGPTVPLRLEMRMYRWCLSFGEFVLNWQDLLAESDESQPV